MKRKGIYKYIDTNWDALTHKQSGYSSGDDFYPLQDMIDYIKENNIKAEKIHISSIYHQQRWSINSMEMVEANHRIEKCDISIPIIINRDGQVIDGYHRIVKSIMENKKWIKAYRIELSKLTPKKSVE